MQGELEAVWIRGWGRRSRLVRAWRQVGGRVWGTSISSGADTYHLAAYDVPLNVQACNPQPRWLEPSIKTVPSNTVFCAPRLTSTLLKQLNRLIQIMNQFMHNACNSQPTSSELPVPGQCL